MSRTIGLVLTKPARSTLAPTSVRMFSMLCLIINGRSRLKPHAMTRTFSGKPMGRNISGRNMPLLPISSH